MSRPGLRDGRQRLVADEALVGSAFGRALADLVDHHLVDAFTAAASGTEAVLVAMGSYARRELCPASDLDVMLVHDGGRAIAAVADALWYPLWDAGFLTGHATRTVKDALSIADADLAALTSMFGVRVLGGLPPPGRRPRAPHPGAGGQAPPAGRGGPGRRRRPAAVEPGPIAELLEPDLKEGAGGLRDLQSLDWAGWTLGGPTTGLEALVAAGYVQASDPRHLDQARELLLTARVALHRVTGRKGDEVPLQEQDAVAAAVGAPDADVLVRDLAAAARSVSWIAGDAWDRLRSAVRGPGSRSATGERALEPGLLVRDGRAALARDTPADVRSMLHLAAAAAEHGLALERESVVRLGDPGAVAERVLWDDGARHDFVRLLLAGPGMVPVVEALDRTGGFGRLVPGWNRVRSLPQRNAYHRYTIDRHLLEAVARCAALLSDPGFDGEVARALPRPHLLALAALFHDIGKGLPGDHSRVGAEIAGDAVRTLGFASDEVAVVERLVEHHLLLADTATRRDLGEEATVVRVARLLGDPETLALLYLLTIGDSLATGASAWSGSKAALVRELYVKTRHLLEQGEILDGVAVRRRVALRELLGAEAADRYLDAFPAAYPLAFDAATMAWHHTLFAPGAVRVEVTADGPMWDVTVAASDRPGMFAGVTAALGPARTRRARRRCVHPHRRRRARVVPRRRPLRPPVEPRRRPPGGRRRAGRPRRLAEPGRPRRPGAGAGRPLRRPAAPPGRPAAAGGGVRPRRLRLRHGGRGARRRRHRPARPHRRHAHRARPRRALGQGGHDRRPGRRRVLRAHHDRRAAHGRGAGQAAHGPAVPPGLNRPATGRRGGRPVSACGWGASPRPGGGGRARATSRGPRGVP